MPVRKAVREYPGGRFPCTGVICADPRARECTIGDPQCRLACTGVAGNDPRAQKSVENKQ